MSRKKSKRVSNETIIAAIKDSGAIMSTIARRLGVEWHTADTWIKAEEDTMKALQDEKETILDMAESTLYKNIKDGNSQDAKWLLSTMGKERGYSDRHEITGADGSELKIKIEVIGED